MNAKIVAQEKSLVYSAQWKLLLVYSSLLSAQCRDYLFLAQSAHWQEVDTVKCNVM